MMKIVAVAHRRDAQAGDDDVAHLVDLGIRGRVDLEHVDVTTLGDLDTRVTHAAGVRGGPLGCSSGPARECVRSSSSQRRAGLQR